MFDKIENRDAWSTLRGFVYQVDITILQWLELQDNEILELEKGEDIDIVTNDLLRNEISRELEQVKYREANITLNQESIIEILLNFYIHKKNNPQQKLYFRFISNTNYGIERPALFINGKSGIETWIELQKLNTIDLNDERYIGIKNHLIKKINDIKLNSAENTLFKHDITNDFIKFINNDKCLLEFIKDFKWSLRNDDYKQISESIKENIINKNILSDNTKAEILYSRLFLYVFKVLCNKHLKSLTKETLISQSLLDDLSNNDKHVLQLINKLFTSLEKKVSFLEETILNHEKQISRLFNSINSYKGSNTVIDYILSNISITPPNLVKNGTVRKEKVSEVNTLFDTYNWINFQGINGTGKSQLASLVCKDFYNSYWLDLRALNGSNDNTAILVETFLSIISNCPIDSNRTNWLLNVKKSLPNNSLIVLNDLPRIEKDSFLSKLLIFLSNDNENRNLKVLTTSNYIIPNNTTEFLENNIFSEYYDFDFSDQEILECLANNNIDKIIINYLELIATVSRRNPRLVSEIIYYLKKIEIKYDSTDLFETIFNREFSIAILQDAQQSIKKYIENNETRELLYRLSLINWELKIEDIITICKVDKEITYPNENLQDLLYTWIERRNNYYIVSPLIYNIGKDNLPEATKNNVYITIAESIISSKKVDILNASRSITSFINGKGYDNAGLVLLKVYQSANTIDEVNSLKKWAYLNYWIELDIPKDMNVMLRVNIRTEQIRLFNTIGQDNTILFDRLEEYVLENDLSISERFFVHLACVVNYKQIDLSSYWKHIEYILLNFKSLDSYNGNLIDNEIIPSLLWIPILKLINYDDVTKWLKYVELLELEYKINFFDESISETALTIVFNNIYISQNSNWDDKKVLLEYLYEYFERKEFELLSILAFQLVISIDFTVFNKREETTELVVKQLSRISLKDSKYLLYETIGRLYFYEDNIEQSKLWLLNAVETYCTYQISYIPILVAYAATISTENTEESVKYCEKAVELAKHRDEYNELDLIIILGELSIAYWLNDNKDKCFQYYEIAVNRLLIIKDENFNQKWIKTFMMLGHTLGYIVSMLSEGRAPNLIDMDYMAPKQGMIMYTTTDLSHLYSEKNIPLFLTLLARFAYKLNNIDQAGQWALRSFDLARANENQEIFLMVSVNCYEFTVINFDLEVAFESSLLFSAVSSHVKGDSNTISYLEYDNLKISELLSPKPSKEWNIAEDSAIIFSIIPIFISTLTKRIIEINNGDYFIRLKKALQDYLPVASDMILWEVVINLFSKIYSNSIQIRELIDRGNTFSDNDRKNLHIICSLGVISNSTDSQQRLQQIISIFPYFSKIFKANNPIEQYVLLPFLKHVCIDILKESFIGNKAELEGMCIEINNISINDDNCLQMTIRPLIDVVSINIPEDRMSWLFHNK